MLNTAITAARNAGKIILRFVDRLDRVTVTLKSRNDWVTEVDRLSEQEIIQVLRKAYPQHGILAEESGAEAGNEFCWIIDPLDGTGNFVHGFPHFSVSIGLQYKGELVLGVVYDPIRQELFTASKGHGAQLNNHRIRVSETPRLSQALIGTGFPFKNLAYLPEYLSIFAAIFPKASDVRRAGSAALDLAYVAAGRLDGFWEASLKPWDLAAGIVLIREAGGLSSNFDGQMDCLTRGDVLAGNPKIYKRLLEVIQSI